MLSGLSLDAVAVLAVSALALDWLLGGGRRWHGISGFGRLAAILERSLNRRPHRGVLSPHASYWRGVLGWTLLVLPLSAAAFLLTRVEDIGLAIHGLILYACIGLRRLRQHALPVAQALEARDLSLARRLAGKLSGRHASESESEAISRMRIEALLAAGNDAVLGTLFWFILAGGAGALAFRVVSALAAMWGNRSRRFQYFGCHALRASQVMNLVPAHLTALSYVVLAKTREERACAWQCWRNQAMSWGGSIAGPLLASGAGALGLQLGGVGRWDSGGATARAPARLATASDIERAWQLVAGACLLWVGVLAALAAAARLLC